jgi:hypothetical protein
MFKIYVKIKDDDKYLRRKRVLFYFIEKKIAFIF